MSVFSHGDNTLRITAEFSFSGLEGAQLVCGQDLTPGQPLSALCCVVRDLMLGLLAAVELPEEDPKGDAHPWLEFKLCFFHMADDTLLTWNHDCSRGELIYAGADFNADMEHLIETVSAQFTADLYLLGFTLNPEAA